MCARWMSNLSFYSSFLPFWEQLFFLVQYESSLEKRIFYFIIFLLQLLGHTQEAIESYTGMINRNLADASSLAVATNNLIALRGTKDTSDSLRKLDRLMEKTGGARQFQLANGLNFKLSQRQKEAIYSNHLLLLLQANKLDQVRNFSSTRHFFVYLFNN